MVLHPLPVNTYNFLRWHFVRNDIEGPVVFDDSSPLPRYKRPYCPDTYSYRLPVVPGDVYRFYINFDFGGMNDYPADSLSLVVIDRFSQIVNFVNLTGGGFDETEEGSIMMQLQFTMPSMAAGVYRFGLFDNSRSHHAFASNEIEVISQERARIETAFLNYSASTDLFNFRYTTGSITGFKNSLRLHLRIVSEDPEEESEKYRSINTGRMRTIKSIPDLVTTFETGLFDPYAHRAAMALNMHDIIEINGRFYTSKEKYSPNMINNYPLSRGRLVFYEQDFSMINRYQGIEGAVRPGRGTFDESFDDTFTL